MGGRKVRRGDRQGMKGQGKREPERKRRKRGKARRTAGRETFGCSDGVELGSMRLDCSSRRGQPALSKGQSDDGEKEGKKETHCSACNTLFRTSVPAHRSCPPFSQRRAMCRTRGRRGDEAKVGGGE
jgi:hypothetical protein